MAGQRVNGNASNLLRSPSFFHPSTSPSRFERLLFLFYEAFTARNGVKTFQIISSRKMPFKMLFKIENLGDNKIK